MVNYFDIKDYLADKDYTLVIGADAEPFVNKKVRGKMTTQVSAGGVSVALEPVARAGNAYFVARGKTEEDRETVNENGIVRINHKDPYTLKRIFLSDEEVAGYYYGFANQVLWPLCHVAFEAPVFHTDWFEEFTKVNKKFAEAMMQAPGTKKLYFVNDYQLSLVPSFLKKDKNTSIGFFWHIPWPTWEIFRILPHKKQLLESLLSCDLLAFHRGYHVLNFFNCVRRELEVRIDEEKGTIFYANHATTVRNFPMGIDTDIIEELAEPDDTDFFTGFVKNALGSPKEEVPYSEIFDKTQVLLGVDRLDYTKGLLVRLDGLDRFFKENSTFRGKVTYLGFLAASRKEIPSYKTLKKLVEARALEINTKYGTKNWQPVRLFPGIFSRKELISLYRHASLCLVTPLDDGMNLVSKEFVVAASTSPNPGMLVLSQFAGSATDLTQAIIVNPYDNRQVSEAIKNALSMSISEKKERISRMKATLNEHNVYEWAMNFLRATETATEENRSVKFGAD